MPFGLLNGIMLLGLVALVIPILIHLLNRRRFETVDWAAMRFLEMSKTTRKRIFIEEPLLMLLRMGLLALLVVALAAPFLSGRYADRLGLTESRDVVLVFDGSTGMSWTGDDGQTTQDEARSWAQQFLERLTPGDKVAIVQAREQPVPVVGELTPDRDEIRAALERLPAPSGGVDWPAAVEAAQRILEPSFRARRDVVLIGSGRYAGWADPATLKRWDLLAPRLLQARIPPRLWAVALARPGQEADDNWSLGPLRLGRSGDSVRSRDSNQSRVTTRREFNTTLKVNGTFTTPYRLRYEIDAPPGTKVVEEVPGAKADASNPQPNAWSIPLPAGDNTLNPSLPLEFKYTFTSPGSHLVSVVVEPDLPRDKRDPSYKVRDRLTSDNRRSFALYLPRVPVLLCDTAQDTDTGRRPSWFLQRAFPLDDRPEWLVRAQVKPLDELEKALSQTATNEGGGKPRVLVLCDLDPVDPKEADKRVSPLSEAQAAAVDRFVRDGGGVLITLGPRADPKAWNTLFKGRDGWLPTRLLEAVGKVDDRQRAARPDLGTFRGPALEPFQRRELASLANARFPRWWRLANPTPGSGARVLGNLESGSLFLADDHNGLAGLITTKSPFIVEKQYGKGRVLLCAVPLNDSWGTNVHETQEVPVFPVLAHELVGHLAGQRSMDANLAPGQPLVYEPLDDESADDARLLTPDGSSVPLVGREGRFTYKDTRLPGVYQLITSRNRTVYYVVESVGSSGSADNRFCTDEEKAEVLQHAPGLAYASDAAPILSGPDRDLWWLGLLAVVLLLCGEVWMTRRIVRNR